MEKKIMAFKESKNTEAQVSGWQAGQLHGCYCQASEQRFLKSVIKVWNEYDTETLPVIT